MKHIDQADRRLRHDAYPLLCAAASARSNVAAVLQTNEHKRHWGKPMSAGDAEILNWTRTQLHMASQDLDIVRNFAREAAGYPNMTNARSLYIRIGQTSSGPADVPS